jgi:hypothetical protein
MYQLNFSQKLKVEIVERRLRNNNVVDDANLTLTVMDRISVSGESEEAKDVARGIWEV